MGSSRRIVVLTRATQDNAALKERLQAQGFEVIEAPTAQIVDVPAEPDLESVATWATWAHAFAFSSRPGVAAYVRQIGAASLQRTGTVIGAVGESTAKALRELGVAVHVVAESPSTGAELAHRLADALLPRRTVVVVQGRWARRELAEGLAQRGHDVRVATVYENLVPDPPLVDIRLLASPQTVMYAAAPSAVARLLHWFPETAACQWVAIGPTTAAALHERGIAPAAVSPTPDLDATAATLTTLLLGPKASMEHP